jgi:hypothetical protein
MTPDDIRRALDRTFAGQSVRVDYTLQLRPPKRVRRRGRRGGLLRPLMNAGGAAAKRAFKAIAQYPVTGRGVVDLQGRRCAIEYKGYGEVIIGDRSWHGAAGDDINTAEESQFGDLHPLLALELLRGAVDVTAGEHGEFRVECDILAAAERTGGDLRVPSSAKNASTLRRLPLYIRLDGNGHIAAVRHELEFGEFTLDVVERGVPAPDWTRIPGET